MKPIFEKPIFPNFIKCQYGHIAIAEFDENDIDNYIELWNDGFKEHWTNKVKHQLKLAHIDISDEAKRELKELKKNLNLHDVAENIICSEPRESFIAYEIEKSHNHEHNVLMIRGLMTQYANEIFEAILDSIDADNKRHYITEGQFEMLRKKYCELKPKAN